MTEFYTEINAQLRSLVSPQDWEITTLANASALLYQSLEGLNWAGFYLLREGSLKLGPFQGRTACLVIPLGKGVCGTAAAERKTQLVPDVHKFPGHIACDSRSQSEIVVPLFKNGEIYGVLDIDSPHLNRFTEEDREGLEEFARILEMAI